MNDIEVGDRVVLVDPERWLQPLRGYASAGRMATVLSIFTPLGSKTPSYRIRFDMRKYKNERSGIAFVQRNCIEKARA